MLMITAAFLFLRWSRRHGSPARRRACDSAIAYLQQQLPALDSPRRREIFQWVARAELGVQLLEVCDQQGRPLVAFAPEAGGAPDWSDVLYLRTRDGRSLGVRFLPCAPQPSHLHTLHRIFSQM